MVMLLPPPVAANISLPTVITPFPLNVTVARLLFCLKTSLPISSMLAGIMTVDKSAPLKALLGIVSTPYAISTVFTAAA
jgi:hypothetical protein